MTIPAQVKVTCKSCGHQWQVSIDTLRAAPAVIYRNDNANREANEAEYVRRRLSCPNCSRDVIVRVRKAWVDDV